MPDIPEVHTFEQISGTLGMAPMTEQAFADWAATTNGEVDAGAAPFERAAFLVLNPDKMMVLEEIDGTIYLYAWDKGDDNFVSLILS